MRSVLFGLSFCLFAAAAVITAAGLSLPDPRPAVTALSPPPESAPSPEVSALLGRLAAEQAAGNAIVTELRREINSLQKEIALRDLEETAERDQRQSALAEESRRMLTELQAALESLHRERALREEQEKAARRAGEESYATAAAGPAVAGLEEAPAPLTGGGAPGRQDNVIAILGGGLFASGQELLSPEIEAAVHRSLPAIVTNPGSAIVIEGHTDNTPLGTELAERFGDNRTLSLMRAEAVAGLLVEAGVDRSRITSVGLGGSRPIATNRTVEGRAENRRVEIRLLEAGDPTATEAAD